MPLFTSSFFGRKGEGNEFLSPQKKRYFIPSPERRRSKKRKKKCGGRVGPGPGPVIFWMRRRRRRRTILQFFYRSFFAPFPSPYLGGRETIFLSLLFFRVGPEFIIFNSPRLSSECPRFLLPLLLLFLARGEKNTAR